MTKYKMILYWSGEDQMFIAEVPELAACAADGATRQEALANAEVAIAEWLETARELQRPIPDAGDHAASHAVPGEETLKAYRQAFEGLSDEEMMILDGIILEPTPKRKFTP